MAAGSPDIPANMPLRFQVGERTLAAVSRRLVSKGFDLESLLGDAGLQLPPLPAKADGMMLRSLPEAQLGPVSAQAEGLLVYVRQRYPRYYASLSGTYEGYLGGFSTKSRSTLKRKVRKFEQMSGGQLDVRAFRTPGEMDTFYTLARAVSQKTYQERLLGSGLPEDETFRTAMQKSAERDEARGYLLFLNGEPVSYLYTPIQKGCVIYAYLGYDPAIAMHSPGTVLQLEAMERLFAEQRHRYFDFTEGDGQHKRLFSTGCVECMDVLLLRPTVANRVLITTHRNFHAGVEALGNVAERYGLKARLKKWLRGTPSTTEATNGGAALTVAPDTPQSLQGLPAERRRKGNSGLVGQEDISN